MTVGLPGAGVGGIFYLLSALMMPVHAATESLLAALGVRRADERRSPPWGMIWRQFATALGIIAGLWLTGWIIAAILRAHPAALGQAQTAQTGRRLPNVMRTAALIGSLATLGGVLLAVQIARLVVASEARRHHATKSTAMKIAATLLLVVGASSLRGQGNPANNAALHMAVADRAFADGDTATARREYEAAVAADPFSSRALYRLGQLSRGNPRAAETFYRRYVAIEKVDPWGWIALGNSLAAGRRYGPALSAYGRAAAIAPSERDVVVGRARILAASGKIDASIEDLEIWTRAHPADADAQMEMAIQQRRAGRYREAERSFELSNSIEPASRAARGADYSSGFAAPAVEFASGGTRDSEANQSYRLQGAASVQLGDRTRGRVSVGRRWLTGYSDVTVDEALVGLSARPRARFRLDASAGIARPHSSIIVTDTITSGGVSGANRRGNGRGGNGGTPPAGTIIQTSTESASNVFVGAIRGVLRQPGGRSMLDLRATRSLLDATPVLAINRVVRAEAGGRADVELIPRLKFRGGARAASYRALGDDNTRLSLLGGLAVAAMDAVELSGVFQRLTFAHATTSGYFAPQVAKLAELGTYAEFETANGTVLAIDAGAGAQRLQEFGASMGSWAPSYRLFASLDIPIRPGSAFHFEVDSYDSRVASDAPSTRPGWRSVSLTGTLRLALH